jgi:hypothetical protein
MKEIVRREERLDQDAMARTMLRVNLKVRVN